MQRVLVTGHAGYIGSVLSTILIAEGHEVVGLDTYYFEDCRFWDDEVKAVSIRKDIRDVTLQDLQGFDSVIHLAALCNDPLGDLNPEWTYEINHVASVRLARLARDAGVRRFLYASSCSLYGTTAKELRTEEAQLCPLTPYAISKARTEEDVAKLAGEGFSPVFMRNATAYGVSPHLRADLVLNNLVCWAYTTGKVRILSDGAPWRPVIHVADIASAFAAALKAPIESIHNEAFNVGVNGENYQVRDLARIVQETVPGCTVEFAGRSSPDPRDYKVDFTKIATTLTDFKPKWNARLAAEELYSAVRRVGLTEEVFQSRKCTRLAQFKHLLGAGCLDSTLRWRERKTR
jgi:nucleoside-diphosphate-sugar epimerase